MIAADDRGTPAQQDPPDVPFLSVMIPCRNEVRFIERCLDSVLEGDYPRDRMEVLVADGRSTDGTRERIARYAAADARVRLLDNPEGTTPWALNHAIDAARGEILARVDAHASIARDYLSRCVARLGESGADNVGGVMRTLPRDGGLFAGPIVCALSHRFGVGNSHFRTGSEALRWVDTVFGGCWRREVFDRVGRFKPSLARSQDMEFSLRLKAVGGRTLLDPTIRCDYFARSRMGPFWRHNFTNGEWAILPFMSSDVIPVSARHLVPLLFVAALGAGLALAPWSAVPLAAVGAPYAALNLAASLGVASKKKQLSYAFLMPPVFASLHLAYGLGSAWGFVEAAGLWIVRGWRRARATDDRTLPKTRAKSA